MNKHFKYDPEDIESLMLAKSFEELLPEERVFVLKHLTSEQEYESMRHLLLQSMEVLQGDQPEPPQDLKEKMMAQYKSHHETNAFGRIWLNFFAPLWTNLWERPYLSLAMASVVLFLGVFFWLESDNTPQMAVESESPIMEQKQFDNEVVSPIHEQSAETKQDAPIESDAENMEVESSESLAEQTAENRVADIAEQEEQEELNQPTSAIAREEVLDDEFMVENGSSNEKTSESSPDMGFARESTQTAITSTSVDAVTSAKAGVRNVNSESLINDELIALLYTAR